MDNPMSGGCSLVLVFILGILASALLLFALVPAGEDSSFSEPTMDVIIVTSSSVEVAPIEATVLPSPVAVTPTPVYVTATPAIIVITQTPQE